MAWNPWFAFHGSLAAGRPCSAPVRLLPSGLSDRARAALSGAAVAGGPRQQELVARRAESFRFLGALTPGNSVRAPSSSWFSLIKLHLVTKVGGRLMTLSGRSALGRQGTSFLCGGLTPVLTEISPTLALGLGPGLPKIREPEVSLAPGPGSASCLRDAGPGDRLLQSPGWASPACLFGGRGGHTMPSLGGSLPCIGCTAGRHFLLRLCTSHAYPRLEKPTGRHEQGGEGPPVCPAGQAPPFPKDPGLQPEARSFINDWSKVPHGAFAGWSEIKASFCLTDLPPLFSHSSQGPLPTPPPTTCFPPRSQLP